MAYFGGIEGLQFTNHDKKLKFFYLNKYMWGGKSKSKWVLNTTPLNTYSALQILSYMIILFYHIG